MRTRTILISSVVLTLLLAALWLGSTRHRDHPPMAAVDGLPQSTGEIRTNVVVRRQFFNWAQLESEDYPTYIANLRAVDCPEETVRDIIIADVDDLFARRRSAEGIPTELQWWQSEPDPAFVKIARSRLEVLERERSHLLEELLGPDWDLPIPLIPTVAIKVPLDGAILSTLSPETQAAVQAVSGRMQQQFERMLELSEGSAPAPAEIALLEQQLRDALMPLLSRSQLDEFLLRYAPTSHQLRSELASTLEFNITPTELQTLFRGVWSLDLQLMRLSGGGPEMDVRRNALLRNREFAFQNALGPARFREYQQLQDETFRSAVGVAQAAGRSEAAGLFYAIERVGQQEADQIRADTSLTPLQQEMALRKLEIEQLEAAAAVLGEPPLPDPTPPSPPGLTYSFQRGDTIGSISQRTGVPVALILRANPGLQAEGIPLGTQIIIPDRPGPFPRR